MLRRAWFAFALSLLLTACATVSPRPASPSATPDRDAVVIVYRTSGGFIGVTHTWTVYASGKVEADDGQSFTADPAAVASLHDQLVVAGFSTQAKALPPTELCPDCTQSDLTLTIDGQPVTLSVVNESGETPPEAQQLVGLVADFIAQQTRR
jgi:hypothetical protein